MNRKLYKKKSGRAKVFIAAVCMILFMIVYVGMQMYILTLEKRIHITQEKCREARELVEEREMKVAELSKGSRIKKIATEKLGMKMPDGAPDRLF